MEQRFIGDWKIEIDKDSTPRQDCLGGSDPIQCNTIQRESGWTQTTTKRIL